MRPIRRILGELLAHWPKGELEALLYIGAAQILYMPEVPDFAAVNETVSAAKLSPNQNVAKVVNGVLRNLIRRREEFGKMLAAAPLEERESYPTALVRRWRERYGEEGAAKMCAWHNEPAVTYLATPDGAFSPLERGRRVTDATGFANGDFIVQDPATARAVKLVSPQNGESILDACAAPGGKTVQMAWRGANVTACEVNPARRRRLTENLARLRLSNAVAVLDDIPDGKTFAKVLVDAPCSNTGVLRRRPDARWNWSSEKLSELVRLQAAILDRASKCVAVGGTIVYSTCSNEPEENREQVAAFVAGHLGFSLDAEDESVPFESGEDGAFAARLVRRA